MSHPTPGGEYHNEDCCHHLEQIRVLRDALTKLYKDSEDWGRIDLAGVDREMIAAALKMSEEKQ